MKQLLKTALLGMVKAVTGRHPVLLPLDAEGEEQLAAVRAPYRVARARLEIAIDDPPGGILDIAFHASGVPPWSIRIEYTRRGSLVLDLATGSLAWGDRALGSVTAGAEVTARRFSFVLTLHQPPQPPRTWTTSHYLARDGRVVDEAYYSGEDYVDYDAQSAEDRRMILALMRDYHAEGPVLDIGCATGAILESLTAAGFTAYGVDFSEWAVAQTRRRLGAERAWRCDIEHEPVPAAVGAAAPFGTLLLASVFEHFRNPFEVLAALTPMTMPGALLIIITTNAGSLTSRIFGRDWEGHFDWTHHGVDRVSVRTLRDELPRLGWAIERLDTHHVWDGSHDPTHATLRDWQVADARFRRLLRDRDLGDFITCIARRS